MRKLLLVFTLLLLVSGQKVLVSYSEELEDKILQYYFAGMEDSFYVDIGGFHPISLSNTLRLYSQGWRGINVEPDPTRFKTFLELRPGQLNLNIAMGNKDSFETFYEMSDPIISTMDEKVKDKSKRQFSKEILVP